MEELLVRHLSLMITIVKNMRDKIYDLVHMANPKRVH